MDKNFTLHIWRYFLAGEELDQNTQCYAKTIQVPLMAFAAEKIIIGNTKYNTRDLVKNPIGSFSLTEVQYLDTDLGQQLLKNCKKAKTWRGLQHRWRPAKLHITSGVI